MSDGLYEKVAQLEQRLVEWGKEYSAHPQWDLDLWMEKLQTVRRLLDAKKEVVCGVLGPMQCGKSTLLNAILGEKVLRTGEGGVCTAAITEIRHKPEKFTARVSFLTREEWDNEVENIYAQAGTGDPEDTSGQQESFRLRSNLQKRLANVYDIEPGLPDLPPREKLKERAHIRDFWKKGITEELFEDTRADKLYSSMGPVMATQNHLWPLIKKVEIFGPIPILQNNLVIVDLPGLGDLNPTRERLTKEYLLNINLLLVVFDSAPLISGEIRDVLVGTNTIRHHHIAGTLPHITFVGTQLDNVADGLDEPDRLEDRLAKANSEATRKLNINLDEISNEIWGSDVKAFRANKKFLTSARECLRLEKKIPGESKVSEKNLTKIPAVRKHLSERRAMIAQASHGNARRLYLELAEQLQFFFRSVLNEFKKRSKTEAAFDGEFKAWLEGKTQVLVILFSQAYASHQVSATQAVRRLAENLKNSARIVGDGEKVASDKWQGMNWATLKAAVVRGGCFTDSRGRFHDLTADAERGYLNLLETVWTNQATPDVLLAVKEYAVSLIHHVATNVENALTWLEARKATHIDQEQIKEDWINLKRQWDYKVETFLETMAGQLNEKARSLSISLAHQIDREMAPAFKEAKSISGPGTKQAILDVLLARMGDIRNRFLGQFSKEIQEIPTQIGVHAPGFTESISKEGKRQWEIIKTNLGVRSSIVDRADMEKKTKEALKEVESLAIVEEEDKDGG
jgi:GTPase SAR1 family protein